MEYHHTQFGSILVLGLGIIVMLTISHLIITGSLHPATVGLVVILIVVVSLFPSLTVEVRNGMLCCRFGVGVIQKSIRLSDIREVRAVRNPWYAGWGIRWVPGQYMLWNISGFQAVELTLEDGKIFRIGSDEPESLARAIRANMPTSTS